MYEFLKILNESQHDFMTEASLEEKLKTAEIDYNQLPEGPKKDVFLSAKPLQFTADVIENLVGVQSFSIGGEGTVLQAALAEPIKLPEKFDPALLSNYVKAKIYEGTKYRFWELNEEDHTITFYQQYQDKTFYKNLNGELTFFINEEREVVSYSQTLLKDIKVLSDKEEILSPMMAIETLYEKGDLRPKSTITKVELGYYTLVHLTSQIVLTPAWRFEVNGEDNLFVNAFEGQIIQLNNEDKKIVE
jgi:regulatory protein YycI of two-component signal transduction system YycFG